MTDKVQKIREWVKARLDENSSKQSLPQFYCMMEEDARFLGFLYFLDTMQEEHDEIVDKYLYGKEPELVDADDLPKEEPVSDDLEEAADNALSNVLNTHKIVNVRSCLEMFRLGAKWQKTKDESTTEDLGEYINELSKQFPDVSFAKLSRIAVRVAKWQEDKDKQILNEEGVIVLPEEEFERMKRSLIKLAEREQQIMAKAIDGVVTFDYYGDDDKTYGCVAHDSFCLEDFGLKDRDKVKVIVIKED